MKYSLQERETSIVWDDAERVARVYTASPATMRKLARLADDFPGVYKCVWQEKTGDATTAAKYEVPARFIRFGRPASAAQIEAGKAKMAKINSTHQ